MNIIGFNGSPRTDGSTAWAVNQILEGAMEQGATTELFQAGQLKVRPCNGYLCCVEEDHCVIADDMHKACAISFYPRTFS